MYSIFRISENKSKSMKDIKSYENHALRKVSVSNADPSIQNEILIGSLNIAEDVEQYIKDARIRKNSVYARDILLTASPEWFLSASEASIRTWVETNVQWLTESFGDMVRFAALHRDEKTLHITCLLVPKMWNGKCYTLNNRELFGGLDGPDKLSKWQDNYAAAMKNLGLERGIKGSKATHLDIKKFYSLLKQTFNDLDYSQVLAKAREREMLIKEVDELKKTLKAVDKERNDYKSFTEKLADAYTKLEEDSKFYENVIEKMANKYHVTGNEFDSFVKSNSRERKG
jgi:hypothetical protein